jgi:hypothetical protein
LDKTGALFHTGPGFFLNMEQRTGEVASTLHDEEKKSSLIITQFFKCSRRNGVRFSNPQLENSALNIEY